MVWLSGLCAPGAVFLRDKGEGRGGAGAHGGGHVQPSEKEAALEMEELLRQADRRVVGSKQVLRALNEDRAARVFLGRDADGFIYHRINGLCEEKNVPVTVVDSMQELGKLCMVNVKTASAAVLK